jgi:inosine-uridine nucleoside N-ribohydrolase
VSDDTVKILFDTDIGSDIDDAVALAYLLAQSRAEVLGITTVSGQPVERARLVSAICKTAGQDIRIVPGSEDRLDGPTRQPRVPQASVLPNWPHETEFGDDDAIEFMADTIRSQPNEVVLLAVGPMTNVAELFTRHPEVPGLLKSLQLMLGRFIDPYHATPSAEWNAHCDPAAAGVVYSDAVSGDLAGHTSLGLDVTTKVTMNSDEVRQHFQHPLLRPVYEMSVVWFDERSILNFHDPLAAVTLFDDTIVDFQSGKSVVTRADDRDDGITDWTPDENGPHRVGVTVDPDRFFESYFGVFA